MSYGKKIAPYRRVGRRTDNNAGLIQGKANIRQRLIEAIGAEDARVFDAFAGEGLMYRMVWHQAARYTGCDRIYYPDEREMFCADTGRVLRAVDLSEWNVFDFDTYGSPWDYVVITAARRGPLTPGERLAIVVTEGSGFRLKFAHVPRGLARLAGVRPHVIGAHRQHQWLLGRALTRVAELLNAGIELSLGAGHGLHRSQMKYAGALFIGRSPGRRAHGKRAPPHGREQAEEDDMIFPARRAGRGCT